MENFNDKLESFFEGVQRIVNDYKLKTFPDPENSIHKEGQRLNHGRRYVKVINTNVEGKDASVFCFVDKTNGNVLKATGWSAPAKHARGNIFDEHNGLQWVNPYGINYLR